MRTIRLALAISCLFVPDVILASNGAPVERIADFIENNYFDPAKAREVATDLRESAKAGAFDSIDSSRELAANLTGRLRKVDRHFSVTWSGSPAANSVSPAAPANAAMSPELVERRGAYGFRRVEMLPGALGYIDMRSFADFDGSKPEEPARKAADAALDLIATSDAVILDLRENGGGSPAMVGYLVSAFTPADANIYNVFHSREGTESESPRQPYARPRLSEPLFVLISGRTGSAAEAAAYTLQAAKRAVIVGETSAGAANPGGFFPVGDGFNVFVSTGSPVNAVTGKNWEGIGVVPDVAVSSEGALKRAEILALEAVLARRPADPANIDTSWTLEAWRAQAAPTAQSLLADYVGTFGEIAIKAIDGALTMQQGKRPAWKLIQLKDDSFFAASDPARRVIFERDSAGKVTGFEIRLASGRSAWFARQG